MTLSDQKQEQIQTALWLSVSEAAKIGGVGSKTIRRAIDAARVTFKVTGNRYLIEYPSLLAFLLSSTKLRNKFHRIGLGQYVEKWKNQDTASGKK